MKGEDIPENGYDGAPGKFRPAIVKYLNVVKILIRESM